MCRENKSRHGSFLLGTLFGLAAGAALGLLLAPERGSETRRRLKRSGKDLRQKYNSVREKVEAAYDDIKEDLEPLSADIRDLAGPVVSRVREQAAPLKETLEEKLEPLREGITELVRPSVGNPPEESEEREYQDRTREKAAEVKKPPEGKAAGKRYFKVKK